MPVLLFTYIGASSGFEPGLFPVNISTTGIPTTFNASNTLFDFVNTSSISTDATPALFNSSNTLFDFVNTSSISTDATPALFNANDTVSLASIVQLSN